MHGADDEGFMFVSIEGIETDITFIDGVLNINLCKHFVTNSLLLFPINDQMVRQDIFSPIHFETVAIAGRKYSLLCCHALSVFTHH